VSPSRARRGLKPAFGYLVLALAFAFIELRLVRVAMPGAFKRSSDVAEGVVHGVVAWRIYQSRVLGPFLIAALSGLTGSFLRAFDLLATLSLAVAGYATLALSERLADRRRPPLAAFALLQLTVLLLLITNWIYPWDLISIGVFTGFNYAVLARSRTPVFAGLFALGILNHEIAFFIGVWLVIDPLIRWTAGRGPGVSRPRFDRGMVLAGLVLLASGAALVEGLRRALLVQETLSASTLPQASIYGRSLHLTLAQNWDEVRMGARSSLEGGNAILIPLFLVAVVALAIQLARSDWSRCGALSIVTLGMAGSFLLFADIYESRALMPLIPFVAMNGWQALTPRE
jgi:hypothetical protein